MKPMHRRSIPLAILFMVLGSSFLVGQRPNDGADAIQPINPAALQTLEAARMLNGSVHADFLLRFFHGIDPLRPQATLEPTPGGPAIEGAQYDVAVTQDYDLDVETTMSTLNKNVSGTYYDHSMFGYMRGTWAGGVLQWRSRVSATKTGDGFWTVSEIPVLPGHVRVVDPVLATHFETGGLYAGRTYAVNLQDSDYDQFEFFTPQSISLMVSDSGGLGANPWFNPQNGSTTVPKIVATNTDRGYYIDKPDAVVSLYSGTKGYLYVAYMNFQVGALRAPVVPRDDYNSRLYVARSTDGGATFGTPFLVRTGRIHMPQISHSYYYNRLYLSWVNLDTDKIEFAWSDNGGTTWYPRPGGIFSPETAANVALKSPENKEIHNTLAPTIPQMRFDWVNNQVILTWHEAEYSFQGTHTGASNNPNLIDAAHDFQQLGVQVDDYVRNVTIEQDGKKNDCYTFVTGVSAHELTLKQPWGCWKGAQGEKDFDTGDSYVIKAQATDVYFTRKTASGWEESKVKLALQQTIRDQFQPSIDFSDTPNTLLIGLLDRSGDELFNTSYQARWIKTTAAGVPIEQGLTTNPFFSNPVKMLDGFPYTFIGDYTDTWFWPYAVTGPDPWGPRFHFPFAGRMPETNLGDIWAPSVN